MSLPQTAPSKDTTSFSIAAPRRMGYALIVLLIAFVAGWGGCAKLSGAVIAPGRISVESGLKRIQHKEGGIIRDVLVSDGARVHAGQVLVRMDATVASANRTLVDNQTSQLQARKLRLEAERARAPSITVPDGMPKTPYFAEALAAERRLMASRRAERDQRYAQLREQVAQNESEIEGFQAQIISQKRQYELISQELVGLRKLYKQGYAPLPEVNAREREAARLEGSTQQLEAYVAKARAQIAAIRQQMAELDSQTLSQVMSDLADVEANLNRVTRDRVAGDDALSRVELKSPVDGHVQQLQVHTRDGVVGPGETLMVVVPDKDTLIIEARIDPSEADRVEIGARSHIRFTAFDSSTTPEGYGTVETLSADIENDERSGAAYYRARIYFDASKLPERLKVKMRAGMPAEVFIETRARNALSYFFKPLTDQLKRVFRED